MRHGFNASTGMPLSGWDHCVQSIGFVLTTRIGTRVMRRAFGSLVPELQDANGTPRRIMQIYAAVAQALREHEPGFRLRTVALTRGGEDGVFVFEIAGIFYPRGHLGDYATPEERAVAIGANDNGFEVVRAA